MATGVSWYRDADGNLIQYRYDAARNLTNLVYPGGRNVYYSYDSHNRLTNVTDWANRKTSFEYDLAGRLRKIVRPNGTVRQLDYDPAGQLTNILELGPTGQPIVWIRQGWDPAGRIRWEFTAPVPRPYTPPQRTMTYDDDNRLLTVNGQSVSHDPDGNMTYGPLTNGQFTVLTYDVRNRLIQVGTAGPGGPVSYTYDPGGNRIALSNATGVTRFVINPNAALSQVLMRVRPGMTNYYIYGLGLLYEVTETATNSYQRYYHYDYRGSTVALTDSAGTVTDRFEYSAYGMLTYRTGSTDTPFLYNGRYGVQTDPNGLLYMRARYYNPYICRFLNPDPLGFSGGLNFYAYADGNPVSYLDPFGLSAIRDYFHDVGQVFRGYADAIAGTVCGIAYALGNPLQTAQGVAYAVAHPVSTFNAVAAAVGDTWNSGPRGQGRIVGEVLIAAASMGASKAIATAGKVEDFVQVSRWGRAGLVQGDFVQLGGVNRINYLATGKWSSLGGNQVAPYSSGVSYRVPSSALHWPTGIDAVKGLLGQRIFDPSHPAMSYQAAATLGTTIGATWYGMDLAGQGNIYGLWTGWSLEEVPGK